MVCLFLEFLVLMLVFWFMSSFIIFKCDFNIVLCRGVCLFCWSFVFMLIDIVCDLINVNIVLKWLWLIVIWNGVSFFLFVFVE